MFSSLDILIERLRIAKLAALLRDVGPYAAIELLLPGGSLIALGLWLYSRHKSGKPLLPPGLRGVVTSAARALFSRPGFNRLFLSRPTLEGFFTPRSEAASQP